MLANQARRFGETLVDRHVLSRDDLEQAIEESERKNEPLPSVLLRLALVGSKDLTAALAEQMGVRFVARDPRPRRSSPGHGAADLQRLTDTPDGVLDSHPEAAGEVRGQPRARHVVRAPGTRALSRERVRPA